VLPVCCWMAPYPVSDGMVVTGFAAQPTNWDESEGGNATSGDHGKTYERMEPWEFTYDSFMG
jgi:hypothetical protein